MKKKTDNPIVINGVEVTDEMFDEWAREYEEGNWQGSLGTVVLGRPRLYEEPLVSVTVRMTKGQIGAVETMAKLKGQTRSEYLREAAVHAVVLDGIAQSQSADKG